MYPASSRDIIENHCNEVINTVSSFWKNEEIQKKILNAAEVMVQTLRKGGKILSCGNGGSMSDAIHFAEELVGRFRESRTPLPAIAISDVGAISCIANDFGYEHVFARYVEALGNENDVLLAISTSGNSQNVINAAKISLQKKMKVIALTGKNGGALKNFASIEIRVPHNGYADRIQEVHIQVIHLFIQLIEFFYFSFDK